jgi:hypothetical protein
MISFLSSAKSFNSKNRDNQLRAIKSWLSIAEEIEVILYGHTDGAKEISDTLGITYIPEIESTREGVPYFNAITEHAKLHARYDTQIYLNCDILMTVSIVRAIRAVKFKKYLMIGQRIDLQEEIQLTTDGSNWINQLIQLQMDNKISLHAPSGKDYFIFPRGLWDGIPPLIVGRLGYDDGLLTFCFKRNITVIDATYDIVAIHQFHDYDHLPGGRSEYESGSDVKFNYQLLKTIHSSPLISDANWILRSGKLRKSYARGDKLRYLELILKYKLKTLLGSYVVRAVWRILLALRIYDVYEVELGEVLKEHVLSAANTHAT